MNFTIAHASMTRLRLRVAQRGYGNHVFVAIQKTLGAVPGIEEAKASARTGSITLRSNDRTALETALRALVNFDETTAPRSIDCERQEASPPRLLPMLMTRYLVPPVIRPLLTLWRALPYIGRGLVQLGKTRLNVEVLDAAAIGVSLLRRDFLSASTIIFLLAVGDVLADWTRRKSRQKLAEELAMRVDTVWIREEGKEKAIPFSELQKDQVVVVRSGTAIPVDGPVLEGEALVNESAMTGESLGVLRKAGSFVYAGTVVEEGELLVRVRDKGDATRIQSILQFIDSSEELKAGIQSHAEHMADAIVPYSFGLSLATFLLTGNLMKASSALMVDYSCAIKLATPLAILAAMREGASRGVLFKGGRFLETMGKADTIVFDKTGTLTEARPDITAVIPFEGRTERDVLRLAACLEEHFPHPVARAVVHCAEKRDVKHHEMHAKVSYIAAHGIVSTVGEDRVVIGSRHFLAEDEQVDLSSAEAVEMDAAQKGHSLLYLGVGGRLAGVLCVSDPIRPEAAGVLRRLRAAGFTRQVMLTGDGKHTAATVAAQLGITEFAAQILPHQKAEYIKKLQAEGCTVVMVGDGINDSPAMALADVGVAVQDGTDLAREVSDVMLQGHGIGGLLLARELSVRSMGRIRANFAAIVAGNSLLLGLGLFGTLMPASSALFHNLLTVLVSGNSLRRMLPPGAAEITEG